jgi:lysophospholipase L1-like esterase
MIWNELFSSWQQLYNNGDTDITHYNVSIENKNTLVVCLGDSWTWGDSLGDNRTQQFYVRHLANHYDADFINAGFRGFSNSWILLIGKLLLEKVKELDYKNIIVAITLTENGRDVEFPIGFNFNYIDHFVTNGISANSYEKILTKIQLRWQEQINDIIGVCDDRFQFFVGQNFAWHDLNLQKNIATTNINWIELLADYQNISRPIRTNLVTGWIFDSVNKINSIAKIIDTSVYKKWVIPYIEKAQLVNQWLHTSELNYKLASRHPTALGHDLWAKHIITSLENK